MREQSEAQKTSQTRSLVEIRRDGSAVTYIYDHSRSDSLTLTKIAAFVLVTSVIFYFLLVSS